MNSTLSRVRTSGNIVEKSVLCFIKGKDRYGVLVKSSICRISYEGGTRRSDANQPVWSIVTQDTHSMLHYYLDSLSVGNSCDSFV